MASIASTASFSHLVGRIYDSAIDPDVWPETLALLQQELGFSTASLTLVALPAGELLLQVASGIPQEWLARTGEYAADVIELWGGAEVAQRFPIDRAAVVSRVNPAALRPESLNRYAREWAFPQGLVDSMALLLARNQFAVGSIGLGRHIDDGPIGDREVAHGELLLPHLQRAAAISRLLDVRGSGTSAFSSVIDALTTPVFLVTSDATILYANEAAQIFLSSETTLTTFRNMLSATQPHVARALARAISQCASMDVAQYATRVSDARDIEPLGIAVRSITGIHALHILPLRGEARSAILSGAAAAVFVAGAAKPANGAAMTAAALFGLTPAETRVFERIASGLTRAETAHALGIKSSTVQTHLLRVFAKLGVRRQADVVQLAATLAPPILHLDSRPVRT